jgi:hypothetical protein
MPTASHSGPTGCPRPAGKPADHSTLRAVWDDWEQDGRAFWQQMDALVQTLDGLVEGERHP